MDPELIPDDSPLDFEFDFGIFGKSGISKSWDPPTPSSPHPPPNIPDDPDVLKDPTGIRILDGDWDKLSMIRILDGDSDKLSMRDVWYQYNPERLEKNLGYNSDDKFQNRTVMSHSDDDDHDEVKKSRTY